MDSLFVYSCFELYSIVVLYLLFHQVWTAPDLSQCLPKIKSAPPPLFPTLSTNLSHEGAFSHSHPAPLRSPAQRLPRLPHLPLLRPPALRRVVFPPNSGHWISDQHIPSSAFIQGVFFNWCPPKNHKFFSVGKFWHLELYWWDLLCNLTLRTFRGAPVKKNTLYDYCH